jgi:hypothetical protein
MKYKTLMHKANNEFGVILDMDGKVQIFTSRVPILLPVSSTMKNIKELTGLDLNHYILKEVELKIK